MNPWLYTLPVPVAVGRMVSRLDPVAVIEKR